MTAPYGGILAAEGSYSALQVTGASAVICANPSTLCRVVVVVGGTNTGSIWDSSTTAGVAASNKIFALPASAPVGTIYEFLWPCQNGIVVNAGVGNTLSVSWA